MEVRKTSEKMVDGEIRKCCAICRLALVFSVEVNSVEDIRNDDRK
jgi:hypothetical protein